MRKKIAQAMLANSISIDAIRVSMSLETNGCQRKFVNAKLSGRSEFWVLNLHRCHPFARKGRIKPTFGQVFWLSVRLRVLPSHLKGSGLRIASPVTAAAPQRNFTVFPILPLWQQAGRHPCCMSVYRHALRLQYSPLCDHNTLRKSNP